jgi:hypothetical protein
MRRWEPGGRWGGLSRPHELASARTSRASLRTSVRPGASAHHRARWADRNGADHRLEVRAPARDSHQPRLVPRHLPARGGGVSGGESGGGPGHGRATRHPRTPPPPPDAGLGLEPSWKPAARSRPGRIVARRCTLADHTKLHFTRARVRPHTHVRFVQRVQSPSTLQMQIPDTVASNKKRSTRGRDGGSLGNQGGGLGEQ